MSGSSSPPSTPGTSASGVPPRPEDGEHDAWLHAALRHAPDADASPPESLRRSILDDARATAFANAQALRGASTTPRDADARRPNEVLGALAAFWSWLARPPVAAAFASVMAATLVGVMWWDRPLDETLPSATPPIAAVRGTSTTAERSEEKAKALAASPADPAAPQAPSTASTTSPLPSPSARPAPAEPTATQAATGDEHALARAERPLAERQLAESPAQPLPRAAKRIAPAPIDAPPVAEAAALAAAPQPFPAPAPRALAKAAPPTSATTPAPTSESNEAAKPSSNALSDALGRFAPPAAPAVGTATSPAAADRPEPRGRMTLGAAATQAAAPHPLAGVLDALAAEPARWSVLKTDGGRAPTDDALRAWLARVDASGPWRSLPSIDQTSPAADRKAGANAAALPATALTLLRDGQVDTIVRVGAGRVVVERRERAGPVSTAAPVSAPAAADLVDSLPPGAR